MTDALENAILAKVIEAMRQAVFLHDLPVTSATCFSEDLGLDSLDVTEIVLHMEERFEVAFASEAVMDFRCVRDVVHYLSRRYFADTVQSATLELA